MSEYSNIEFEVPQFLIHHYYISGAIAVVFNCLVIYFLIFHSGRIGSFKFYLLGFQISCVLLVFHATVLMEPLSLSPICAGYSNGLLSNTLSTHALLTIFALLVSSQLDILSICFLQKHRVIMRLKSLPVISTGMYTSIIVFSIVFHLSMAFTLNMSNASREKQMEILDILFPALSFKFRSLPEFQYYAFNSWMIAFVTQTMFGTMKSFVLVVIMVIQMYRTLKEVQCKLSSTTIAKHKSALRSLVAQFCTTPIAMLPAGITTLTVLFPSQYSQKVSWYCMMVMTAHSTINSIVIILTYPEFRKRLFFWEKNLKRASVVTIGR
ncbi:Serpentine Receptor, class I [Caenorhabditis elegans]|uniref:Serpentine Receptor, class I n=1 Tax=Caenorhabditis elegans TaxID=6239 RepID=Q9U3M4_CAEEL|nr:Serpentine Receptor, class I [Caenorhabditis elegans]CAB60283.1 Serpentine Receptor, class I [Caenorhabditis elegans]|eukprot:NP_506759.1 Serpentine Receptor, class I [Caenorhabditis elegans]